MNRPEPATQSTGATRRIPVLLLMLVSVSCQIAIALHLPSLPTIQADLSASGEALQLTLGVYLLAFAGTQLFVGPLSDRIGRRPLIIAGLMLSAVAATVCALTPNIDIMIAARGFQGVGNCAAVILARAIVRDLAVGRPAARAQAMLSTAMAVAPAFSPLIGGQIELWADWRYSFGICALAVLASALLVFLRLPETAERHASPFFSGFAALVKVRTFVGCSLGLMCASGLFYTFLAAGPEVFITGAGLPPEQFGFVTMSWAGSFILGAQVTAQLGERLNSAKLLYSGAGLSLAAALSMALVSRDGNPGFIVLSLHLMAIGLGNGLNVPNTMAIGMSSVPARIAGAASAAMGILQFGFGAFASWIMGLLSPLTAFEMAAAITITACGGMASHLLVARPGRAGI